MTDVKNIQEGTSSDKSFDGCIFICCKFGDDPDAFKYDLKNSELITLAKRPPVRHAYPVFYKNLVYMTGGRNERSSERKTYIYNVVKNVWDKQDCIYEIMCHSACILHDQLYMIGGWTGRTTNEVKRYDFSKSELISEPSMNVERQLPGLGIHGECIYACGSNTDNREINSFERFDPREGKWQILPNMKFCSGWCTSAVIGDEFCLSEVMSPSLDNVHAEKFNIRRNAWENMAQLDYYEPSFFLHENHLYSICCGGVAQYDHMHDKWNEESIQVMDTPIAVSLSG